MLWLKTMVEDVTAAVTARIRLRVDVSAGALFYLFTLSCVLLGMGSRDYDDDPKSYGSILFSHKCT